MTLPLRENELRTETITVPSSRCFISANRSRSSACSEGEAWLIDFAIASDTPEGEYATARALYVPLDVWECQN